MQLHDWCLTGSPLSNASRPQVCVPLLYHAQRQQSSFPSQSIPKLFRKEFKHPHFLFSLIFHYLISGGSTEAADGRAQLPWGLFQQLFWVLPRNCHQFPSNISPESSACHQAHWARDEGTVRLGGDHCCCFFLRSAGCSLRWRHYRLRCRPPPSMSLETNCTLLWPQVSWVLWFNYMVKATSAIYKIKPDIETRIQDIHG